MKALHLRDLTIDDPLALGSMAGVTDLPFRTIAAEMGCGMFYTEMVSAHALYYHNRNTEVLLETGENEHPVGLQLFGSDPDMMADEALKLEDRFDFIDVNMGCPVQKVVRNNEGSALLRQPELVEKILKKMVDTLHKPVTVKIRKGFGLQEEQAPEIARIAEACGVSMVAVHGRTREQFYSGKADWNAIRHVKEAVSIPVIGNGDILTGEDGIRMLRETGCDGLMVARGAEGNPWIFREIRSYMENGTTPERPSPEEVREMILRHARMLIASKGEHTAILEMRKHASWYLAGQENVTKLRPKITACSTFEELEACILSQDVI